MTEFRNNQSETSNQKQPFRGMQLETTNQMFDVQTGIQTQYNKFKCCSTKTKIIQRRVNGQKVTYTSILFQLAQYSALTVPTDNHSYAIFHQD